MVDRKSVLQVDRKEDVESQSGEFTDLCRIRGLVDKSTGQQVNGSGYVENRQMRSVFDG